MSKIKRRAPKDGYDNEEKMKYRHEVWSRLAEKAKPILDQNENAKVLMLPSKEGLEIDVAMQYGIKPEQIIAIDENPALLAHAKWKDKIPKENRHGVKVSRVGEIIKKKGWILAAANLDFCNNFSDELIDELQTFIDSGCLALKSFISITLMKGRETKALLKLINKTGVSNIFDEPRLTALCEVVDFNNSTIKNFFEGAYYNSIPIIYGCLEIDKTRKRELSQGFPESIRNDLIDDFTVFIDSENSDIGIHMVRDDARFDLEDPPFEQPSWFMNQIDYMLKGTGCSEVVGQALIDSAVSIAPVSVLTREEALIVNNAYRNYSKSGYINALIGFRFNGYRYYINYNYHSSSFLATKVVLGGSLTEDSYFRKITKEEFMGIINKYNTGCGISDNTIMDIDNKYRWRSDFPYS